MQVAWDEAQMDIMMDEKEVNLPKGLAFGGTDFNESPYFPGGEIEFS